MFHIKKIHRVREYLPFAALLLIVLFPQQASAANVDLRNATTAVADIASQAISAMNMLTWIVFVFLNYLLDPNFIFDLNGATNATAGNEGAFMDMLNRIWQLSRDIVNVCFAIALLFSSVYTVFTAKRELLQQYAPKFIMAVILVNFSWFIPRMALDIANITASTVYSIPSVLESQCSVPSAKELTGRSCTDPDGDGVNQCSCVVVVDAKMFLTNDEFNALDKVNNGSPGWKCPLGNVLCVRTEILNPDNVAGHAAILNGLVINQGRLEFLAQVPQSPGGTDKVSALIVFVIRTLLVLVIHIALFFPLLAMMIAFAIRIPVLWITMAFMPFAFLGMVVDEKFTFGLPKMITEHFVKAAFLPAIVGVPLTVGFILINAGSTIPNSAMSGLTVRLLDNVSTFWELLWLAIALGVLYTGVFAALQKVGGVLATGAESLKQFGNAAGRLALKAPLAMPILPSGQAPLFLLKKFNPRNIEAAISGPQGFGEFKKRWDDNAGGPENRKNFDKLVTDKKVDALNIQLKELKNALLKAGSETARKDVAQKQGVEKLKSDFNVDVRMEDLQSGKFESYKRELQEAGATSAQLSEFETLFKEIGNELKKKDPAPPPPPTPAP